MKNLAVETLPGAQLNTGGVPIFCALIEIFLPLPENLRCLQGDCRLGVIRDDPRRVTGSRVRRRHPSAVDIAIGVSNPFATCHHLS